MGKVNIFGYFDWLRSRLLEEYLIVIVSLIEGDYHEAFVKPGIYLELKIASRLKAHVGHRPVRGREAIETDRNLRAAIPLVTVASSGGTMPQEQITLNSVKPKSC